MKNVNRSEWDLELERHDDVMAIGVVSRFRYYCMGLMFLCFGASAVALTF